MKEEQKRSPAELNHKKIMLILLSSHFSKRVLIENLFPKKSVQQGGGKMSNKGWWMTEDCFF